MSETVIATLGAMVRWEPNSRARLEQAAMALFEERGFDTTTVAEIAARAGLTERTFFRYFADKREVLFAGGSVLQEFMVNAVADAPESLAPIDIVAVVLKAAADGIFQERYEQARRRQAVIMANVELQERELIKLASLAAAITEALRRRGVSDPAASLSAEAGIAVFRIAFERWVTQDASMELGDVIRASFAELRAVTTGA